MNNIGLIAFPDAPTEVFKRGEDILQSKLNTLKYSISDTTDADILFILTGGSENKAKNIIKDKQLILILTLTENNSFAAASEIKAYSNQHHIQSVIYNLDNEENIEDKIENFIICKKAIKGIANYKIGLIGNVSGWLIASDVNKERINNKLGIQLQKIDWNEYADFQNHEINANFVNHFKSSEFSLEDSSRVYNLLSEIKNKEQLDAITVECFPLVRNHEVTACLALSKFNSDGLPAGCEGDITSILGKTIVKELTGQIPWMANLVSVKSDEIFLAHCTIATNLVNNYHIITHFETNVGTAIQGDYAANSVTIFRLNNELDRAFIAKGEITERPTRDDACRTQIKVQLSGQATQKLIDDPLGNHHLVLQGDFSERLTLYCKLSKIEII